MKVPATHLVEVKVARKEPSGIGRSLVKTITYRIVSATSTMLLAWFVFGSLAAAGLFGTVDLILNTILYFTHERVWARYDIQTDKEV